MWEPLLNEGVDIHVEKLEIPEGDLTRLMSMLAGGPLTPITMPSLPPYQVLANTWKGDHFLYGKIRQSGSRIVLATTTGKKHLEDLAGEWLRFEELEFK